MKPIVAVSPHIVTARDTKAIMLDVILALTPAMLAGTILFGARALLVLLTCVVFAVGSEYLFCLILKKPQTVTDLSAVVTGVILALNLPVGIGLWQAAIGAVLAIVVVKEMFGGLGNNFANPALVGRIALFLSFTKEMSAVGIPSFVDGVSSATPLAAAAEDVPGFWRLFLGAYGGMLGETCSLALLLGGAYLIVRRVITWHTPVSYLATVALLTLLFGGNPLTALLSGGLLLGAIFMATDYATTPITSAGRVVFGIGCGVITSLIRSFGSFPEGVSFAILFMSFLTPYIDRLCEPKPVGAVAPKKNA